MMKPEVKTLDFLKHKLTSQKDLSGWMISSRCVRSHQIFLTKNAVETRRTSTVRTHDIQIFHKHRHEGKEMLGTANFDLDESSLGLLDQELEKALFAASLVHNEPFTLPEAQSRYPDPAVCDQSILERPERLVQELAERLQSSVGKEKNIRLASSEFFLDHGEETLTNHRGLTASQNTTKISAEIILLAEAQGQTTEFIARPERRLLKDFDLEQEVRNSAQMARDRLTATPPPTGAFDVVFSEEALDHLFNPFVSASSAAMRYNRMSTSEPGKPVLDLGDVSGDKLTLWSNGVLNGALGSRRFDGFGTPMGRELLIQDNILQRYWATQRYADYLKVSPTGEFGNVEVALGTRSEKELLQSGRVFQLLAFSVFEPNPLTGAFSAEIRMGYEITPSGRRPIRGGSVAGTLSQAFRQVYFSKEQVQRERYLGPRAILCPALTLAGE